MSALLGKMPPVSVGRLGGGLLAAARPLATEQWEQGVNFNSHVVAATAPLYCQNPSAATEKTIGEVGSVIEFLPFLIYSGMECSTWMDTNELLELARLGLANSESAVFARQLQQDDASSTNPGMADTADVLAPATGVVQAFSRLLAGVSDCGVVGEIVFHVPLRALPYLMEKQLVRFEDGLWRHGPFVVVADLYDEDIVPAGEAALTGDESDAYFYATGPIEIAVGPVIEPSAISARTNESVALAERLGILRFDPNCVKAVRVDF